MTKLFRVLALTLVCASVFPAAARAQGFITPFIGYNFGGDSANCLTLTNCEEKRTNFGVSLGSMGHSLGFEEDISYAKNFFGDAPGTDNSVFTLMSNLIVGVPTGPVRPYVVGGVGLIRPHVSSSVSSVLSFSNNSFGYDFGAGLHVMAGSIGVRGDIRRFKTTSDIPIFDTNEPLTFWRGSVGLTIGF